jgi:uncharacterized protein (DUF2147 family)
MHSHSSRIGTVLGLASLCAVLSCSKPTDPGPAQSPAPAKNTNSPAAVNPELKRLEGKWQRPDGGYVLQIKSVGADGMIDAAYFNPNSIHVHKAAALRQGDQTKVFVELRDQNYPGSTYTLAYDPKSDQLYGQYFQATMQQTYDIFFERIKEQ